MAWAHPEFGQIIASCSFDRTVVIWEEAEGMFMFIRRVPGAHMSGRLKYMGITKKTSRFYKHYARSYVKICLPRLNLIKYWRRGVLCRVDDSTEGLILLLLVCSYVYLFILFVR